VEIFKTLPKPTKYVILIKWLQIILFTLLAFTACMSYLFNKRVKNILVKTEALRSDVFLLQDFDKNNFYTQWDIAVQRKVSNNSLVDSAIIKQIADIKKQGESRTFDVYFTQPLKPNDKIIINWAGGSNTFYVNQFDNQFAPNILAFNVSTFFRPLRLINNHYVIDANIYDLKNNLVAIIDSNTAYRNKKYRGKVFMDRTAIEVLDSLNNVAFSLNFKNNEVDYQGYLVNNFTDNITFFGLKSSFMDSLTAPITKINEDIKHVGTTRLFNDSGKRIRH
jgi:hypothetical protein